MNYKQCAKLLLTHENILIVTHRNPDGDTVASAAALCSALRRGGRNTYLYPNPQVNRHLRPFAEKYFAPEDFTAKYTVAVDVATEGMLPKGFEGAVDLCIDHHPTNSGYAGETLVRADKSSCAEAVMEVILCMNTDLTPDEATLLYIGLTTDTGCFRYSNVTPRTMRMAAEMIECGADNVTINTVMFETKTRTYVALEKLAVGGMKMFLDGKCALITVTQEMYRQSGSDESEVDAIASLPRQIEGVLVGVTMRERKDGSYKISMRSNRPINVSEICAAMGGGGHPQAAGCQVGGTLEEATETVIDNVKKYIEKI